VLLGHGRVGTPYISILGVLDAEIRNNIYNHNTG